MIVAEFQTTACPGRPGTNNSHVALRALVCVKLLSLLREKLAVGIGAGCPLETGETREICEGLLHSSAEWFECHWRRPQQAPDLGQLGCTMLGSVLTVLVDD